MTPRLTANLALAATLLLALALRVWGLTWGLPSALHYFSYHPDESMVLSYAMGMSVFRGDLLPHFYNYGSLQLYLVLFANTLDYLFGHGTLVIRDYAVQHDAWARQYLMGRWLTVGMGVGTVWATYALGMCLWGRRAGLAAALLLAVVPLHAQHSHFLTVDVPATFWAVLSLVWAARLMQDDPRPTRAAVLAGLFAGLAAATKYNLALALLPLVYAAWTWRTRDKAAQSPLILGGLGLIAALVAFVAACPGIILEPRVFRAGLLFEANHVRNRPEAEFLDTGSGFVYHVTHNLSAGLGLPLLLLALASLGYALWRREQGDGLLAAFALPYYVLIGLAAVRYARYVIPLLPVLALWAGRMVAAMSRLPQPIARAGTLAVGTAVLALTLGDCVWLLRPMAAADNRDVALARIQALNPPLIGFAARPWFGTPPVSPWFCAPIPGSWRTETSPTTLSRIAYTSDWDAQTLGTLRPPVIVLSEDDYEDALRLHDPAAEAYIAELRRDDTLWAVIAGPDAPAGTRDGLPTRDLPSDMRYPDPIISLYTRR